ncbi:UDP-glycosyltransferase UGT5 [Drosophila willistoni]|uniref:UDP-glycosyltransferase UGT5 n=1 Tax=Drosophila willistoni TaxID=7260 RepID=UPI000C26D60A|nr:UDP-glycosyltransferase UGT5 [Drosophila willistoni]
MVCLLRSITFILAMCVLLRLAQSSDILAIAAYTFPSPYLVWTPYLRALVERGHQVTMVSSVGVLDDIEGVRHIRLPQLDKTINGIMNAEISSDFLTNKWIESALGSAFLYNITYTILSDKDFQQFLTNKSEHVDLIVLEPLHSYALFSLSEYYDAPLVGLAPFGPHWITEYLLGNISPSVYEPVSPMGYSHGTDFWSKWQNWWHITEEWLLEWIMFWPGQVELSKKFFGHPPPNGHGVFSLILINHHFSMGHVRSNVPNIIEVAGLHLSQPAAPLDAALQRFLDEAEFGVIYFSMGLEILSKWLPMNLQKPLLRVFAQLKQRVVWKYELETLPNKSDNIYISQTVPQRQLLAHPNVKLFITHGGLLGIIESICYGVPMLGLPVYYDQFKNMERMRRAGIAENLDTNSITEEQLAATIHKMLEEPRYTDKAKQMSSHFADQPMSPLDSAVWWTDYVLRHKGAPHMRLDQEGIPFVRYYKIDTFALVIGRFALIAIILILLCVIIIKKLRGRLLR